jgi:glycosyltransferase involved in cell wall biosynthesis
MTRLVILTEIISPYRIPVFNALAQHPGISLHVIFLAETDPVLRQWEVHHEQIRFSHQVLPSWRRRLMGQLLLVNRGLSGALRQAEPEVILCGGYNYLASWQCLAWAGLRGVPFLSWVESTQMDQRSGRILIEFLKQNFIRRCGGFVVPGMSSFEYVRSFGVREERIFKAPNAVDSDFFACEAEKVRKDEAAFRERLALPARFFLFVGRLVPEKGVFDLLQAYSVLPPELRSEVGLVFVGDGPSRAQLERQAALGPGAVRFPGFLQREELAACYALAEVFVLPTHSDPWGLVVNEAMACSLPIICTSAAGCAADLITDRWNGRLTSAGDIPALASAMGELARDAEARREMGLRSQRRIQDYSPEACAAGMARAAFSSRGVQHG